MYSAKKTLIYIATFIVTVVVVYTGLVLVFGSSRDQKPVSLKVVGFWDTKVFNNLKAEFQKENPLVTIEYEQRQPENYLPTLAADLQNETTTADVFWWHSGWGPELSKNLAPLPDQIMTSSDYEKTFYPITKTDLKIAGSYRGFPLEMDGLALLYNKNIFAAANFKEPPTTWASLRQVYGQALTTRDKQRILNSAIALGSVNNVENFSEILGLFLLQNGVAFTKNGQLNLLKNESAQGTNLVTDAIDGYVKFSKEDKLWDNTLPNSIEAFAKGSTAMIILPAAKIHKLLEIVKKENVTLSFGVVPVPQLPDSQPVTWGSYWAVGVSEKSRQKEASWKLAKFLVEQESLRTVFKAESEQNDFGRVYPRIDMAKEQTTHPYLAAYVAQAATAKSWYLHSDTADQGLNDTVVTEFKTAVAQVEKGTSTASALKSLTEKIKPTLQKYGLIR